MSDNFQAPNPPQQNNESANPFDAPPHAPSNRDDAAGSNPSSSAPYSAGSESSSSAASGPVAHSATPNQSVPAGQVTPPTAGRPPKKSKKRLWIIAGAVLLALLLGGGYVFAVYLPNTPDNVYSSSLKNSGVALDKLIDYSKSQKQANYTSAAFDGTANIKSGDGSYDFNVNGSADKNYNANLQMKVDALGEKVNADVRSVRASGNTSPDVYVRLSGVKNLLDAFGMSSLGQLDGKWIVIDHTLIDTYLKDIKQSAGVGSASNTNDVPTYAELQDAIVKVQAVNKQYLFTADASKAVLTNEQYLGKVTQNGRTLDHYKVGYNKAHLQAYVTALGQALDSSQLNSWSRQVNNGKSLSEFVNINSLKNSVNNAKSDYTFELWADTQTKLISKLAFTDPNDSSSVFTVGQQYNGGNVYPFSLNFRDKAKNGQAENVTVGLTLNTVTHKTTIKINGTAAMSDTPESGTVTVDAKFAVTPSNKSVSVSAPGGAKSITDILISLGLGGQVNSGSPASYKPPTLPIVQ